MEKMVLVKENEVVCDRCLVVVSREDAVKVDGDILCPDCVCTCFECGEVLNKDNAVYCEEDDEWYCEECAERMLVWCDNCERFGLKETSQSVIVTGWGARRHWCGDCVEREAIQCDDCGAYVVDSDIGVVARGDRFICPCCREDYYFCDECEEYVPVSEWDYDADMCEECAKLNVIKRYHSYDNSEKKSTFVGELLPSWRGIWRGIGIELEVEHSFDIDDKRNNEVARDIATIYDGFVFEHDSSVAKGFEIISQPHTKDAFNRIPWGDILGVIKEAGYQSHNGGNCGLHIHFSREYFGSNREKQDRAVAKMIRFYDCFYDDMVKVSRRDQKGADDWAQPSYTESNADALRIAKGERYIERYRAVNTNNSRTVEIRIMRGTLKLETFKACVDIAETICHNSRTIKWDDICDVSRWLKGISPATAKYIRSRGAFVGII